MGRPARTALDSIRRDERRVALAWNRRRHHCIDYSRQTRDAVPDLRNRSRVTASIAPRGARRELTFDTPMAAPISRRVAPAAGNGRAGKRHRFANSSPFCKTDSNIAPAQPLDFRRSESAPTRRPAGRGSRPVVVAALVRVADQRSLPRQIPRRGTCKCVWPISGPDGNPTPPRPPAKHPHARRAPKATERRAAPARARRRQRRRRHTPASQPDLDGGGPRASSGRRRRPSGSEPGPPVREARPHA